MLNKIVTSKGSTKAVITPSNLQTLLADDTATSSRVALDNYANAVLRSATHEQGLIQLAQDNGYSRVKVDIERLAVSREFLEQVANSQVQLEGLSVHSAREALKDTAMTSAVFILANGFVQVDDVKRKLTFTEARISDRVLSLGIRVTQFLNVSGLTKTFKELGVALGTLSTKVKGYTVRSRMADTTKITEALKNVELNAANAQAILNAANAQESAQEATVSPVQPVAPSKASKADKQARA